MKSVLILFAKFTKNLIKPHTEPEIICATLEEFSPQDRFDIVICENWLGTSAHEISLLDKLAGMVANQGVLVLTTVSPIGFVPNLLRRFFSSYLAPLTKTFQQRTEILTSAFSSHLDTLTNMTRNHIDWVQDNMLNPAYFKLCLSIPAVARTAGTAVSCECFSALRFLKIGAGLRVLHGSQRRFNEHFLTEYWKKAHNFLDYREPTFARDEISNRALENKACALIRCYCKT